MQVRTRYSFDLQTYLQDELIL